MIEWDITKYRDIWRDLVGHFESSSKTGSKYMSKWTVKETCLGYGQRRWPINVRFSLGIHVNDTKHIWWWISIGNGLVSAGNKPIPEAMLTLIYVI